MKTFSATTDIHATPEAIWAILTDASRYTEWDPGMDKLDGLIAAGQTLAIRAKISPNRIFKVKVSEFIAGRKMVWRSGMPLGLFKGVRTFLLEPQADGKTRFSLQEEFSGPLLPLIGGSLPDMNPVFAAFAEGLKKRAEGG